MRIVYVIGGISNMDAAGIGKHITHAILSSEEAIKLLDMGVNEEISEKVALLCADTQLMFMEHAVQRARGVIRMRRRELGERV